MPTATLRDAHAEPPLRPLRSEMALRDAFNAAAGWWRGIVFLSPSCKLCQGSATWMEQNMMVRHPNLRFQLFVVWEKVHPQDTEAQARHDYSLMRDARVTQFWDADARAGRWFYHRGLNAVPTLKPESIFVEKQRVWDAYFLFGPRQKWAAIPDQPVVAGLMVGWPRATFGEAVAEVARESEALRKKRAP